MLQMVKKWITWEICHASYWYEKANNKNVKDYDQNKKLSYIKYWDVDNETFWKTLIERFNLIKKFD